MKSGRVNSGISRKFGLTAAGDRKIEWKLHRAGLAQFIREAVLDAFLYFIDAFVSLPP